MKKTLTKSDFRQEFHLAGRGGQFSYEGLGVLFDLLEEINPDMELDVIELCCEFSEIEVSDIEKETGCKSLDELNENTLVLNSGGDYIIYKNF